jgi:hypothetical protein
MKCLRPASHLAFPTTFATRLVSGTHTRGRSCVCAAALLLCMPSYSRVRLNSLLNPRFNEPTLRMKQGSTCCCSSCSCMAHALHHTVRIIMPARRSRQFRLLICCEGVFSGHTALRTLRLHFSSQPLRHFLRTWSCRCYREQANVPGSAPVASLGKQALAPPGFARLCTA